MLKLVKCFNGAVLGYVAYCAVVLGSLVIKEVRLHYFDKEAVLAGAISPIGALGAIITGDWNYPLWVWFRDFLAYALIIGEAVLGLRSKHRAKA